MDPQSRSTANKHVTIFKNCTIQYIKPSNYYYLEALVVVGWLSTWVYMLRTWVPEQVAMNISLYSRHPITATFAVVWKKAPDPPMLNSVVQVDNFE